MGQLGFGEMLMIFVIALLVFGPKKLPELGKSLGKGIREFKKATEELKSSWDDHVKDIAEPINDARREIHSMGQNLKTEMYGHLNKVTEPETKELSAPAPPAAASTAAGAAATATTTESHDAPAHSTESDTPKEHV